MLGTEIFDDVESRAGRVEGLGYLPLTTRFHRQKTTRWREGETVGGGEEVRGFEIHHGQPVLYQQVAPWFFLDASEGSEPGPEGSSGAATGIWGTSLHGILECDALREALLHEVARRRGKTSPPSGLVFESARDLMADQHADALEANLDLDAVFKDLLPRKPLASGWCR